MTGRRLSAARRVDFVVEYRRSRVGGGVAGEIVVGDGFGLMGDAAVRQSVRPIFKLEAATIEEFVNVFRGRRTVWL